MRAARLLAAGVFLDACGGDAATSRAAGTSAPADAATEAAPPATNDAGGPEGGAAGGDAAADANVCANQLCGVVCADQGTTAPDLCVAGVCSFVGDGDLLVFDHGGGGQCDYACTGLPCGTVCSIGSGICDGAGHCADSFVFSCEPDSGIDGGDDEGEAD